MTAQNGVASMSVLCDQSSILVHYNHIVVVLDFMICRLWFFDSTRVQRHTGFLPASVGLARLALDTNMTEPSRNNSGVNLVALWNVVPFLAS